MYMRLLNLMERPETIVKTNEQEHLCPKPGKQSAAGKMNKRFTCKFHIKYSSASIIRNNA